MWANLENSVVATGLEKISVFIPIPKKGSARECAQCCAAALMWPASQAALTSCKLGLSKDVNWELHSTSCKLGLSKDVNWELYSTSCKLGLSKYVNWELYSTSFKLGLSKYVNWELPDVQSGFRKGRGTRDQIANICWIIEKAREKAIAPHSSTLAWKIPWTDEPGRL